MAGQASMSGSGGYPKPKKMPRQGTQKVTWPSKKTTSKRGPGGK